MALSSGMMPASLKKQVCMMVEMYLALPTSRATFSAFTTKNLTFFAMMVSCMSLVREAKAWSAGTEVFSRKVPFSLMPEIMSYMPM